MGITRIIIKIIIMEIMGANNSPFSKPPTGAKVEEEEAAPIEAPKEKAPPLEAKKHPEVLKKIKLGARLSHFAAAWEKFGDKWAQKAVRIGATFPLSANPPLSAPKKNPRVLSATVGAEIRKLVKMGAVIRVKKNERTFLSELFIVDKSDGSPRLICDLAKLNKFIPCRKFKMTTLKDAFCTVPVDSWATVVDLKHAYLQIPIRRHLQRLLSFQFKKRVYKYRTLVFGLNLSPLIFSKILLALIRYLRKLGVNCLPYLDDLFTYAHSEKECDEIILLVCTIKECSLSFETLK